MHSLVMRSLVIHLVHTYEYEMNEMSNKISYKMSNDINNLLRTSHRCPVIMKTGRAH